MASPTVMVGPYDFRNGPSNGLILNYLASPVKLSYDGGINVASVRNVARGHRLLASAGTPGETYILGGHNVDYATFYRTVAELAGLPAPAWHLGAGTMVAMSRGLSALGLGSYYSPFAAEEQLGMVGKYFWYSHRKAAAIGYTARPLRMAIAEALGWIAMTSSVSTEVRRSLRLSDEVHRARLGRTADYRSLLCPRASAPSPS